MERSNAAVVLQIIALTLGFAAALWGAFCVYGAAFPGPCGDNPGPALGVLESWVICLPIGLLELLVGWLVKSGSRGLRRLCLSISLIVLLLPLIATFFFHRWHCG